MSAGRARNVLIAALAISLLLHLLLAGFIRWRVVLRQPSGEPALINIRHITIARAFAHTPPPTPVPLPIATPHPRTHVSPPRLHHSIKPAPSHVSHLLPANGAPRGTNTASLSAATPAPLPSATAASLCAQPDAPPAVASTPEDPPDISAQARAGKVSGTAAIAVSLDSSGHVIDAKVAQSSGDNGLDLVAVQMAQAASYSPKYVACKAVASEYTFTVKFAAW